MLSITRNSGNETSYPPVTSEVAPPLPPPRVTTTKNPKHVTVVTTSTTENNCTSCCSSVQQVLTSVPRCTPPSIQKDNLNSHRKTRSEGDCGSAPVPLSFKRRAAAAVRSWLALVTARRGRSRSNVADSRVCRHCGVRQNVSCSATSEIPKKLNCTNRWMSQASLLTSDVNRSYYVRSLQRDGGQTLMSGTYPNRATVSATFDTDSDYVQVDDPGGAYVTLHQQDFSAKEAPARFITSNPHISVLMAHASKAPKVAPCFATPTKALPPLPSSPVYGVMMDPVDVDVPLKSRTSSFSSLPSHLAPVATIYSSQVALCQITQFQQQLCSNVDYVVFPLKDPAISQQEYLDAKQTSLVAKGVIDKPPPPYRSPKMSSMYRSAPNVASSLPSTLTSVCSSGNGSSNCSTEIPASASSNPLHHNNVKKSSAYVPQAQLDKSVLSGRGDRIHITPSTTPSMQRSSSNNVTFDIASLRAKSRDMDLPLISALCNDCFLLQQTSAFSPTVSKQAHCSGSSLGDLKGSCCSQESNNVIGEKLCSKSVSGRNSLQHAEKNYPVSGLSTVQIKQISKNGTLIPSLHQHSQDKSPPRYVVQP